MYTICSRVVALASKLLVVTDTKREPAAGTECLVVSAGRSTRRGTRLARLARPAADLHGQVPHLM